jgi:alkanesulfonate monooxygenase
MADEFEFDLYAQAPTTEPDEALAALADTARLAERHGYAGMLLHHNHRIHDPWVLATALIGLTERLVPLVALQPYSIPPMTAANMVHTLAELYQRRVDINLIAGASPGELRQVNDPTPHDERYARATEYMQVLRGLLSSRRPLDFAGRHYRYDRLEMETFVDPALRPRVFVAGSSPAGRAAAAAISDVTITHPEPIDAFETGFAKELPPGLRFGIRIGLLARPTAAEAWEEARERYPVDRGGLIATRMKLKSESRWSRQLAVVATAGETHDDVYWTGAFTTGKVSFPLLVGDYARVRDYVARYLAAGVSTVLVGNVMSADDFHHAGLVFDRLRPMPASDTGIH